MANNQTAQGLTSPPEACPGGCDHTAEEHIAFDAGVAAGNAGKQAEDCPYEDFSLREDWLTGQSVGAADRLMVLNGDLGEGERTAMSFWILLLIATNFAFATYFFAAALELSQRGDILLCAFHVLMVAVNGGMGTSTLCKLLK